MYVFSIPDGSLTFAVKIIKGVEFIIHVILVSEFATSAICNLLPTFRSESKFCIIPVVLYHRVLNASQQLIFVPS